MSHLLRRCSSTSQIERNYIYRAIQQQNPTPPAHDDVTIQSPDLATSTGQAGIQVEISPPTLCSHQQQSALDTLAEVSRQHLSVSSNDRIGPQAQIEHTTVDAGQQESEEQFFAQLREAVKMTPVVPTSEDAHHATKSTDILDAESSSHTPPPLKETASAANEKLEQTLPRQENLDPALQNHEASVVQASPHAHVLPKVGEIGETSEERLVVPHGLPNTDHHESDVSHTTAHPEPMVWVPTSSSVESHPSSQSLPEIMTTSKQPMSFFSNNGLAVAHTFASSLTDVMEASKQPMSGFGPVRNSAKGRSKFTDTRRKEVQDIRKRGACIRCRMLKKPCSEGTPCNTCKTVGSARLWKGSCLRTRLSEEYTLWSVETFNNKARATVDDAFEGLEKVSTDASIDVRLLLDSDLYMTFPARKHSQNSLAKQRIALKAYGGTDPDLALRAQFEAHMDSAPIYLLEEQPEVLPRLESNIPQVADSCISDDISPFLKATLQRAQIMIRQEEAETSTTAASPSHGSARACYTFQNQLLRNVVEVWVETTILTRQKMDENEIGIDIRLPAQDPPMTLLAENLPLLHTQLYALLETRSIHLSKSIMNELERRLLQRQQVSRFATFLSSIILLSCIERMTGFMHSQQATAGDVWLQGSPFADLLIMLLRMRGLPPRTMANGQGKLVVVRGQGVDGGKKQPEFEALEQAGQWLDPLGLDFEELARIRDGGDPAKDAGPRAWDMKFIARAILPVVK